MKKAVLLILLGATTLIAQSTNTPNIGLQIPPTGSDDWNLPLDYNFVALDSYLGNQTPLPNGLTTTFYNATVGFKINGSYGTNGYVLTSTGTGTHWAPPGGSGGLTCSALTPGVYPIATGDATCADGTIDYGSTTPDVLTIKSGDEESTIQLINGGSIVDTIQDSGNYELLDSNNLHILDYNNLNSSALTLGVPLYAPQGINVNGLVINYTPGAYQIHGTVNGNFLDIASVYGINISASNSSNVQIFTTGGGSISLDSNSGSVYAGSPTGLSIGTSNDMSGASIGNIRIAATNTPPMSTSGFVDITGPASTAGYGLVLPSAQGMGPLSNNGSGQLSFELLTAPSGSCTPSGLWVFSQDGHATFCNAGTWQTKI